mmetsp:Transcript_19377/g.58485  ORF Transcript_19377/g.58485 Transcript_19377/m.58485 type:complete len:259 (-) Transcript_19377:400-1176(-)
MHQHAHRLGVGKIHKSCALPRRAGRHTADGVAQRLGRGARPRGAHSLHTHRTRAARANARRDASGWRDPRGRTGLHRCLEQHPAADAIGGRVSGAQGDGHLFRHRHPSGRDRACDALWHLLWVQLHAQHRSHSDAPRLREPSRLRLLAFHRHLLGFLLLLRRLLRLHALGSSRLPAAHPTRVVVGRRVGNCTDVLVPREQCRFHVRRLPHRHVRARRRGCAVGDLRVWRDSRQEELPVALHRDCALSSWLRPHLSLQG